jgi:hypothetical protein
VSARTPAALCHAVDDLCRTLHAIVDRHQLQSITHDAYALLQGDPSVAEGLQDAVEGLAFDLESVAESASELAADLAAVSADAARARAEIEAASDDAASPERSPLCE